MQVSLIVEWNSTVERSLNMTFQINQSHKSSVEVLRWVGAIFQRQTFPTNHNTIQSVSAEFCWSIEVGWRQFFSIEHFPTNHITNQSVSEEFCWSIEVVWRQFSGIEHFLQITIQINQSHQSSVEVLRWVADSFHASNISYKSHHKPFSLIRVLLKYWGGLETVFTHRTFPTNHITNQSVWLEFCWSIGVGWRQFFSIEHFLQITLQINQSHQSSVEVLRWVGDNLLASNILYKSHYKPIRLIRVLLEYWGGLQTVLQHRKFATNHITNQSVSSDFCWSSEVGWRQFSRIEHFLQITLQIDQSQESSVEVLGWVGDSFSASNISYKSHCKSIGLIRVLLKYWGGLETIFQHRIFPTNHITNHSVSPEFCLSTEVGWRHFSASNISYKSHYKSISLIRVLLKYWGGLETVFSIEYPLQITFQINQSQKSSVEVLRWVGDSFSASNILYKSHYKWIGLTRVLS